MNDTQKRCLRCPQHRIIFDAVNSFKGRWCDIADIYCKINDGHMGPHQPTHKQWNKIILNSLWWLEKDGLVERNGPLKAGSVWRTEP